MQDRFKHNTLLDYKTARKLFRSRCPHHTEFPYKTFHLCEEDEVFLLVDIPLKEIINTKRLNPKTTNAKIRKLENIPNHDPIWVYFMKYDGQQWVPTQTGNIKIADGTHRTIAKIRRGDTITKAFFPQTQYIRYQASKLRNI